NAVRFTPLKLSMPTYTTSTAIHRSQFSISFFVIMYCATRLTVVVPASTYGSATPGSFDVSAPSITQNATAMMLNVSHVLGGVRETRSSVWPFPPYSHSYQP